MPQTHCTHSYFRAFGRSWHQKSTHHGHTVQSFVLPKGSAQSSEARIRSSLKLDLNEYWVGRISTHQLDNADGDSVYDRFRDGLLVDHSEQERQYIESCIESERLQVFREREAEGKFQSFSPSLVYV